MLFNLSLDTEIALLLCYLHVTCILLFLLSFLSQEPLYPDSTPQIQSFFKLLSCIAERHLLCILPQFFIGPFAHSVCFPILYL
ncbi:hypothetical protein EDB87DRAFT_1663507 [Lactarius vividus]|nr:hypothetical protein EDB87DRAFT_1663507 [Lactarius vividus]